MVDNLFHITPVSLLPIIENKNVSAKRKVPNTNQTFIWRLHLGHINLIHSQFMELGNLFEVIVHHLLIGRMGGLGPQDGLLIVSTLMCIITH